MLADLRYGWRQLKNAPIYTLVAVLTLALGVGANTAIFSVVKAVLLDQLPYRDPDRLLKIAVAAPDNPLPETIDYTTTYDLRERSHLFQSMSLFRDGAGAMVEQGNSELLQGMRVSADYFDTLGSRMLLGRSFVAGEDQPETRYEVILTHGLWLRRFGGDPAIVGRSFRLGDRDFKIVGVLPENFRPMLRSGSTVIPDIYMPLGYDLKLPMACRGCQHLQLIGRMKPGVTPEQARAELNSILQQLKREHPNAYDESSVIAAMPLRDATVGQVKSALWILLAAVGFVLLIACANVAHLAMARVTVRSREMAVRAALGAARGRLLRQMFSESLLLAFLGGLAGVALAWCGTSALATLGPAELPRAQEIRLDLPVLLFALAVSLLTGLLFGMAPAIRASQTDPMEAIKDSEHSTQGRARSGYRNALVVLELAMAFVLVMGAGLLGRSLLRLLDVNPGYDPHNVLTAGVYVYGDHYQKPETEIGFYEQAMQRLRATPGVDSTAMVSTLPLANFDRRALHIQDRPLANESEAPAPDAYAVSPDYFRVLRIPLKRGRPFTSSDRLGAPGVALISESCARAVFPNQDPIGRHIQLGGRDDKKPWLTIVGIVGDVRQYGFDQPSRMEAYIAEAQDVSYGFNVVIRTTGDPRQMEPSLRAAFASVDGTQPLYSVEPLEAYVAQSQSTRRFTLLLLALFGGVALLLAAIGVYGVISYAVSLRTRELGIRMALGAAPKDVLQMVLGQGLRLAGAGLAIGLVASMLLTRFLSSLLFEVHAGDLFTAAAVTLTLASVALLANYLPARRAAGVDPAVALRCE